MRKLGEYDFKKMSDSWIMYLQRPPRFLLIFLVVVMVILAGLFIWSNVAVKAETVETSGIVVSADKTPLTVEVDGKLAYVNINEGEYANKGDILFSFDKTEINSEMAKYEYMLKYYQERIELIDIFLEELNNEFERLPDYTPANPFYTKGREWEFYNIFESYIGSLNLSDAGYKSVIENQEASLIYERNSCEAELESQTSSVNKYQTLLKKYDILAPISGTVHYDYKLLNGTVLNSGIEIGSISSSFGEKKIEIYVDGAGRSRINVGDDCYFVLNGLAQSEFGSINGTIESISSDATLSENAVYFKTYVSFDADKMTNHRGEYVNIVNGMQANVWVTVEKMTYWNYLMEQLGLYKLGL